MLHTKKPNKKVYIDSTPKKVICISKKINALLSTDFFKKTKALQAKFRQDMMINAKLGFIIIQLSQND